MATPPRSVAIRAASASDVETIAALHLVSWWAAYRGIVPDQFLHGITLENRIARRQRALSSLESPVTETTVAVDGDTVLGVCSFGPRLSPKSSSVGEVYALHVEPGSWRRGIGKLLLDDSLGRLAARGFVAVVLWVLRDNWSARQFYEAQGWSVTGGDG